MPMTKTRLAADTLGYACRAAYRRARQLVRSGAFPSSEQADLEQDLLLEVVRRFPLYDPTRGPVRPFIACVVSQAGATAIRRHRAAKRNPGPPLPWTSIDIDEPYAPPGEDGVANSELAFDYRQFVRTLPPGLRRVAELLPELTLNDIAGRLRIPRSTAYRRRIEIRERMREAGLDAYLWARVGPRTDSRRTS